MELSPNPMDLFPVGGKGRGRETTVALVRRAAVTSLAAVTVMKTITGSAVGRGIAIVSVTVRETESASGNIATVSWRGRCVFCLCVCFLFAGIVYMLYFSLISSRGQVSDQVRLNVQLFFLCQFSFFYVVRCASTQVPLYWCVLCLKIV